MDPAKKRKEKNMGDYYVPSENEVFQDRYRLTGRKMGMVGLFQSQIKKYTIIMFSDVRARLGKLWKL